MFACPVHSYINDLPLPMESMNCKSKLPMESMNCKSKLVYYMFCHTSIEPGVSFCTYVLLVT